MTATRLAGRVALLLPILAGGVSRTAVGQGRIQQIITLGGGASHYNINGFSANTYVFNIRFDGRFGPYVIFEPGAALLRFKTDFGEKNYILPELSLQVQGYVGPVRPFIGGGGGFANIATGVDQNQFTLHAVTGVRIHLVGLWGVRLEARARSIDPWHSHTLDFTAGIMRVLPTY